MSRTDKKSKFTEPQKSNNKVFIIVGIVIVALLAAGGFMVSNKSATADPNLTNVGATSYQVAEFAKVNAANENGDIVIDLNEIKNKKSLTFDIQGINYSLNNVAYNSLPILAYVTPQGNVVVASSICEPCSGFTFHIEGEHLVCNACGTRWTLEDLKGVSTQGCPNHPPAKIKYSVEGDKLIIKKGDLDKWQPRPV